MLIGVIVVVAIIVLILLVFFIISRKNIYDSKANVLNSLKLIDKKGTLKISNNKIFDYSLERNGKTYLFKVVRNFGMNEIMVTNKNHWLLNDKVVNSKNSGSKIEGIYDLINLKVENYSQLGLSVDVDYKKVYIIYPGARALVRAINESEMIFLEANTESYGVYLITHDKLVEKIDTI